MHAEETDSEKKKKKLRDNIINSMVSKIWQKRCGCCVLYVDYIRSIYEIWTSLPGYTHTHALSDTPLDHSSPRVHTSLWRKSFKRSQSQNSPWLI